MKVRSFKGYRRPQGSLKRGHGLFTLRGDAGKTPRRVLALVIGLLLIVILTAALRPRPMLMSSAEIATVWDKGVLRVGVRTDVPGLAENGAGLEVELATLLAQKIITANPAHEGTKYVELVPVNSMDIAAKLTDGTIDVAIALMPVDAFAGYAYSRPYYTDTVYLATRPGEEGIAIRNITIGCIQSASSTSFYVPSSAVYNALAAYIDAHEDAGLTTKTDSDTTVRNITAYASYEDLFKGLARSEVDAIALSGLMAKKYAAEYPFGISATQVGQIGYAVACLSDTPALASVADWMLSDMEQDGTLDALKAKYGLD